MTNAYTQVFFSLCLINYTSCHEDTWGSGGIAPPFLTPALDRGEWSASRSGRFPPGKESLVTIGYESGGRRAGLDAVEYRKSLALVGNPTTSFQAAARRYTD
jgi:hypothetical protein